MKPMCHKKLNLYLHLTKLSKFLGFRVGIKRTGEYHIANVSNTPKMSEEVTA